MSKFILSFVALLGATSAFAAPPAADKSGNPRVVFETTKGNIVVELFADKAPLSTKNMLEYVSAGFYNGTVFHRVIPGFMIQGGGYTKELNEKPTKTAIKNEAANGLSNKRGTLAMARTGVVDSATAQFFINLVDNTRLDHRSSEPSEFGYAVFGQVVSGLEIIDGIARVERICPSAPPAPCTANIPPGMMDVPKEAVIIVKASRQKK